MAILGKSGSGKSTLMHAISGLDKPQQGEVLVDGEDILRLKARATDKFRAQKMAFIFQSFFVEGGESCYDNVSLSLETAGVKRSVREQRIEDALAAVDLADKIKDQIAGARSLGRAKAAFGDRAGDCWRAGDFVRGRADGKFGLGDLENCRRFVV